MLIPLIAAIAAALSLSGSAAAPPKTPSARQAAAAANGLGFAIERRAGHGNVVLSPFSAWSAVTMPYAGAAGETRAQMARVLRVQTFGDGTGAANRKLTAALLASAHKTHATLAIANRLWGALDLDFVDAFLKTLRVDYGAPLERADFKHDSRGARQKINAWVAQQTHNRIKNLFLPQDITRSTLLAVVDAIYLKARWRNPFDPGLTEKRRFHAPGRDVKARTMYREGTYAYARLRNLRAIALPYRGGALSMLIVLPDRGKPKAVERSLSAKRVQRVAGALRRQDVDLYLPRFRAATRLNLAEILKGLGMPRAFSDDAEFPGVVDGGGIELGAGVQKAWIRVGEKGTEAAAATGLTGVPSSARYPPPKVMDVNRPFLFLVRDNRTGAVLFLGRITDPTK